MNTPMSPPPRHSTDLQVGLIGYGNAGRIFHAPLIAGVPGLALACICSSKPQAVHADWPQVRVVPTPEALLADPAIDVVVIATANDSHHPLARAALLAGKHVVVDKPCTVTLAETEDLLALAAAQGRVLTVFQNRRLDADFLSLRAVLDEGRLGRLVHLESHFDRYRPVVPHRWREQNQPGSGLWVDLGAHLADQAMQLLGMPDAILLDTAVQREGAVVNDWFHAQMSFESRHPGLRVILHGSALVPQLGPRWIVHGTRGSFIKQGMDPQEDALKAGRRPRLDVLQDWGADPALGETVLQEPAPGGPADAFASVKRAAPAVPGNYLRYYANLRDHLRGDARLMVSAAEVRSVMTLLMAGEHSARERRWMPL